MVHHEVVTYILEVSVSSQPLSESGSRPTHGTESSTPPASPASFRDTGPRRSTQARSSL